MYSRCRDTPGPDKRKGIPNTEYSDPGMFRFASSPDDRLFSCRVRFNMNLYETLRPSEPGEIALPSPSGEVEYHGPSGWMVACEEHAPVISHSGRVAPSGKTCHPASSNPQDPPNPGYMSVVSNDSKN
jgi:hypothetical protein